MNSHAYGGRPRRASDGDIIENTRENGVNPNDSFCQGDIQVQIAKKKKFRLSKILKTFTLVRRKTQSGNGAKIPLPDAQCNGTLSCDVPDSDRGVVNRRHTSADSSPPDSPIDSRLDMKTLLAYFTPGLTGLKNHGNTCFVNSVIQCLCNNDSIAQYILTNIYTTDLENNTQKRSRKLPQKGEVTCQFAALVKALWTESYKPEHSECFKAVISDHAAQYKGHAQHDAQEFLMWLLDQIHEDVCVKVSNDAERHKHPNEDQKATEALSHHNNSTTSFIYERFQALFQSSLTCPHCKKTSDTFDPFLCLSLPIPQRHLRPVYVNLVYADMYMIPKQVRIAVRMNCNSIIEDLREAIQKESHIPAKQILLVDLQDDGFHRSYFDDQGLTHIPETSQSLHAIELPYLDDRQQQTDHLLVVAVNTVGTGRESKRFGSPIVFVVPRELTFSELQTAVLDNMVNHLKTPPSPNNGTVLFRMRVINGIQGQCYLLDNLDLPLYVESVDKAITSNGAYFPHLKLVIEWDKQTKNSFFVKSDFDPVQEDPSVQQVTTDFRESTATLDQCLEMFTKEEMLGEDDAWNCPNCKKIQQGTIKKLNIWSLPDVLVVHLKRFKQVNSKRMKLNNRVEFPMELDLANHVRHRRSKHKPKNPPDNNYDLYAVCNHYGNMTSGHYTAFCKNPVNSKWYTYDDMSVQPISSKKIVTEAAYMLFYQQRAMSSTPDGDYHWSYDIPEIQAIVQVREGQRQTSHRKKDADIQHNGMSASRSLQAYGTLPRKAQETKPSTKSTNRKSPPMLPTTTGSPVREPDPDLVRSMVVSSHQQPRYVDITAPRSYRPTDHDGMAETAGNLHIVKVNGTRNSSTAGGYSETQRYSWDGEKTTSNGAMQMPHSSTSNGSDWDKDVPASTMGGGPNKGGFAVRVSQPSSVTIGSSDDEYHDTDYDINRKQCLPLKVSPNFDSGHNTTWDGGEPSLIPPAVSQRTSKNTRHEKNMPPCPVAQSLNGPNVSGVSSRSNVHPVQRGFVRSNVSNVREQSREPQLKSREASHRATNTNRPVQQTAKVVSAVHDRIKATEQNDYSGPKGERGRGPVSPPGGNLSYTAKVTSVPVQHIKASYTESVKRPVDTRSASK